MYQFSDNLSFTRSSHNFKTGLEFLRYGLDRAAANVPLGNLSCCPGGYSLAGWLMGYPTSQLQRGRPHLDGAAPEPLGRLLPG